MKVQMGADPTIRTVVKRTERGNRSPSWMLIAIFLGICILGPISAVLGIRIGEALTDADIRSFVNIGMVGAGGVFTLVILLVLARALAIWNRLDDASDERFLRLAVMLNRGGSAMPSTQYKYNVRMPEYPGLPVGSQQMSYTPRVPQVVYMDGDQEVIID